jgi:photosystem II stability/assembly factor-like uncharacterized protein
VTRRLFALSSVAAGLARAGSWRIQYAYDEIRSSLQIADLAFASARVGVALGKIVEGRQERAVAIVTSDGGVTWSLAPLKEPGVSLFFLSESAGWMATGKGLWRTADGGRKWTRLHDSPKGALRVWFLDEQHGFAAGARKGVWETRDGGRRWRPIAEAAEPASTPDYSAYTWIQFATPSAGIVAGLSRPPLRGEKNAPDWSDPSRTLARRELPHLSFLLQTTDGGRSWHSTTTSMLGQISRIRFGRTRYGLWLVEFGDSFGYPSEVYRADSAKGGLERVYRAAEHAVTDVWIAPSGVGYLAGIETRGGSRSPAPGKVKVMASAGSDLAEWSEVEVDYKAEANRVMLAGAGERDLWLATDTGMILKLTP